MRDRAIFNLYSNAVTVGNNGEFVLDKDMNPITIDDKKVEEEYKKLKAEYDSKQYQRDRADVYPSIQEQLDMQYWDAVNGTNKWQEAVAKVKTDHPKPSE